jgi:uncharacterized protein YacL
MFFTDIDTWTQKRLRLYALIFNALYLLGSLVIPIIIVGCRYQIFHKVSSYRLTGWGWICAIIVAVVSIRVVKKVVNKLPESTHKEQILKYSILGIRALFIPVLLLIAMRALKNDFDLAYNTLWWCLISYTVAIVIDYTCIKYLDREIDLRRTAKEKIEVDKRVELLKK